jgi:hypothetical protein
MYSGKITYIRNKPDANQSLEGTRHKVQEQGTRHKNKAQGSRFKEGARNKEQVEGTRRKARERSVVIFKK